MESKSDTILCIHNCSQSKFIISEYPDRGTTNNITWIIIVFYTKLSKNNNQKLCLRSFPKRAAWAKLIWGFIRNKIRMPREYVHKSPCVYDTLFKISKTIDLSCVFPLHSGLYFVALGSRGTGSILEDPISVFWCDHSARGTARTKIF